MYFLVDYNRTTGQVATLKQFERADHAEAAKARLHLELSYAKRRVDHEVVILEAADETDLRRTHRRYFEDLSSITATTS
jgi:hypothetical protein